MLTEASWRIAPVGHLTRLLSGQLIAEILLFPVPSILLSALSTYPGVVSEKALASLIPVLGLPAAAWARIEIGTREATGRFCPAHTLRSRPSKIDPLLNQSRVDDRGK